MGQRNVSAEPASQKRERAFNFLCMDIATAYDNGATEQEIREWVDASLIVATYADKHMNAS